MKPAKKISDSIVPMTELVLPNHTNQLGKLLGGQLMHWIDICAALCASKHNQRVCVTASVDRIDFIHPVKLGDMITLIASVNRVFNTFMEIGVKVYAETFRDGIRVHT
ncbi:MAG: acyl-CoA thioesterase, partial [Ignavibacteriales bacterium]